MNEPEVPKEPDATLDPVASSPKPTPDTEPIFATFHRMWGRLKAHKVVQWTLAYLAIAYTLLHGAEMLAGSLNWSHGFLRVFTLVLILGIPVIVTLAWYHGARGLQRVSGTEIMIIAILLALGGAFLWRDSTTDHEQATKSAAVEPVSTTAPSPSADARPSIAVLPFENRSQLKDDAYFVDGVHDDILTQLSKISSLRVISRTSVERFRKSELSIKQIAEQLGVGSVLEGGVQRAGETVRINVQLINARDDAHLWADSYDRKLTAANIFEIQSEIANAIAGALKTSLNPAEQSRLKAIPTQSLQAWQQYQRGKQRLATRNSASLVEAEGHFRKAVALDPAFALAWVGLADALALQTLYAGRPFDAAIPAAEQAVAHALKLDPDLAEAWTSAANNAAYRLQPEKAVQMFKRAIALNPNYATAHHWLSTTLVDLGRFEEALTAVEHAVALTPCQQSSMASWVTPGCTWDASMTHSTPSRSRSRSIRRWRPDTTPWAVRLLMGTEDSTKQPRGS